MSKPRTKQRSVPRLVQELKEWCADANNAERLRTRPLSRIAEILRSPGGDPEARSTRVAASLLGSLATWYSNAGASAVMDGDPAGWREIERGRLYRLAHVRILARAYELDPRPADAKTLAITPQFPALLLAHCLVIGDDTGARELAVLLEASRDGLVFGDWAPWPVASFVAELARAIFPDLAVAPAERVQPPGVYSEMLRACAASSRDELRVALVRGCDYHVEQSFESAGFAQYTLSPYELFPVELLATSRLVAWSPADVNHPLFETALASREAAAAVLPLAADDVLDAVQARAVDAKLLS